MKNYTIKSLRMFLYVFPFMLLGQDLPEIIPPSPTVANLMQFEEVPVSYYTGQPNISIPIYSKALNGDLAVNVGLSYNTQGVKINNRSGWTGTSWSLNAGGVISRTVRGEPDEITIGTSETNKTGIYHLNEYWNYENLSDALKAKFNFLVMGDTHNKYDNKPDLYQFNFMDYSGRFVILKEGNTLVPKFISKSGKFKIEFNHNPDYVISDFTVTDPKGYKYTFDVVENSTTAPFSGSIPQGSSAGSIPASGASLDYYYNSAWHLSKVETSNNKDLVLITYQDVFENYVASASRTENRLTNPSEYTLKVQNGYNQAIMEPRVSISYNNISTITKKVNNINFVRDNINVSFGIDSNYIHPETNGRTLKTISIKKGNVVNKTYNLTYEETEDNSALPTILKRVWLTKVTESAGTMDLDYKLSYNNKESLPGFNNQEIRGDSWGYYSGIGDSQLGCSANVFDNTLVTTGLLSSIEYPTGGVKEFEFEHNSYSYYQNFVISPNDILENPRNIVPVTPIFIDDLIYNNSTQAATELFITSFTLNFAQDIYVSSWLDNPPSQYVDFHRIKIFNNNYSIYVDLDEVCELVPNVPAGNYTMVLTPSLLIDSYQIKGDYRVNYTSETRYSRDEMIGGGVRIKNIVFKDNNLTNEEEKRTTFVYNDSNYSNRSSGVVDAKGDRLERKYTKNTFRTLFDYPTNECSSFYAQDVWYNVNEKTVNVELSQGSYIGYKFVKVVNGFNENQLGANQNIGYSTYSYTSPSDYPSPFSTFNYEQPKPVENLDYKRGLLLEQKIYDTNDRILKKVSHLNDLGNPNYAFDEELLFIDRSVFRPNCAQMQFFTDYDFWVSGTSQNLPPSSSTGECGPVYVTPLPCEAFPAISTEFKSGWAKLLGTTTTEYFYDDLNNQSEITTKQEFEYNDDNYQISQQDTYYNKAGVVEHLRNKYYYPVGTTLNSNTISIKNMLVNINKVNEVLETENFRNNIKLSETHTIYDDFSINQILPKEVKIAKGNSSPDTRIEFHKYDDYGNPLEVSKTNGVHISYIYGFNKSVPVAKISNATYTSIEAVLGTNFSFSGNLSTSNETGLRNNLPNALISFYRYDPIIGVISTTDEKGYEMTYEYDASNRLIRVKDADGKIMGENSYRYQNQY